MDLTIEPDYLGTKASNAFEAAIQLELCTVWKNALASHLLRVEARCVGVAFTRVFRGMQDLLDHLRRKLLQIGQVVEEFRAGGGGGVEEMGKGVGQKQEGQGKGIKPQQQHVSKHTSKPHVLQRSKEPNCGFGASTRIIRFQGEGEATNEKEVGDVVESSKGTHSDAQRQAISQMKKKTPAGVSDVDAPQTPVPQSKKRPAHVTDLEKEADETPRAKKGKTNASGDGGAEL